MPETVPAVIDPLFRTACSCEVFIDIENIVLVFSDETAHDARPDIGCDDQLEIAAFEFHTVFPTLECHFFHVLTSVV